MSGSGDYISREAAIAKVAMMAEDRRIRVDSYSGELVGEVMRLLRHIPAADVRPVVRAEFVRCGDGKGVPYMCSHCGRTTPANMVEIRGVNFCPNCGAWMEES